jgi:hypothetical protein
MRSSLSIRRWAGKPNRPRYYVTDGREPVGTVFEARGQFSAINVSGDLIAIRQSLTDVANALVPTTAGASSS